MINIILNDSPQCWQFCSKFNQLSDFASYNTHTKHHLTVIIFTWRSTNVIFYINYACDDTNAMYKFTNSFLDASVTTVREKRQCQIWRMIIITSVVRKLLKIMIGLHDSYVFQRLINSDCVANQNGARWQLSAVARSFSFCLFCFFSSVFCWEETADFRPSLWTPVINSQTYPHSFQWFPVAFGKWMCSRDWLSETPEWILE